MDPKAELRLRIALCDMDSKSIATRHKYRIDAKGIDGKVVKWNARLRGRALHHVWCYPKWKGEKGGGYVRVDRIVNVRKADGTDIMEDQELMSRLFIEVLKRQS